MHRNILLRVSYLLQRAATHLLRIFKGTFFTIDRSKDTTKSLGLREIGVLEATSRREETNANGGTKWRQISKTWKNHLKHRFWPEQNIFPGNVICRFGWENKKIRYSHFKSKKEQKNNLAGGSRAWKSHSLLTSWNWKIKLGTISGNHQSGNVNIAGFQCHAIQNRSK